MEKMIIAAVPVRNRIGQVNASIEDMMKWANIACEKGADLILFPELNVNGYIPAPVAHKIAETIPGPRPRQSSSLLINAARQLAKRGSQPKARTSGVQI